MLRGVDITRCHVNPGVWHRDRINPTEALRLRARLFTHRAWAQPPLLKLWRNPCV
jgi:hypothetical protein